MKHTTNNIGGKLHHTLRQGKATAHNFTDLEVARKTMKHYALTTDQHSRESNLATYDKPYCSVVEVESINLADMLKSLKSYHLEARK